MLARGEEGQRATLAARAAGAPDAVHVGLGLTRNIEVDDEGDTLDVEASGGHVGRDQHVERAVLEALDHALALGLSDVTGNTGGTESAARELQRHLFDIGAGTHEDDGGVSLFLAFLDVLGAGGQHAGQRTDLVLVGHHRVGLVDGVDRRGLGGNRDLDRILQVLAGDLLNGRGHRRAEQRGQSIIRGARRDRLDVLSKTHTQHLVGLVEDQHAHVRQVEGALLDEVDDAARGADDDLSAALERADLRAVGRATVDGDDVEAGRTCGEILDRLGTLHRELARGRQHEGLDVALVRVNNCQQRQAEGSGLSGTRLGDADDVAQLQQRRDGSGLNRGRDAESHVGHCRENLLGQSEAREGDGLVGGFVAVRVRLVDEVEVLVCVTNVIALVASVFHVVLRGHSCSLPVACG